MASEAPGPNSVSAGTIRSTPGALGPARVSTAAEYQEGEGGRGSREGRGRQERFKHDELLATHHWHPSSSEKQKYLEANVT